MAKILILDDSEIILTMTRDLLQAAGHTVATQSSPAGLPAVITRERPDLLLLDVSMPLLNGDQTLRVLRARGFLANIIVLLFSARPATELAKLATACGAHGYVSKNDASSALVTTVNDHLAKRAQTSENVGVTVK
jgi:CheY-like chemotaxis protein